MPTLRNHTHCQVALGHSTKQNLSKSMSAQSHTAKLTTQNEKHENLTIAKNSLAYELLAKCD